MTSPPSLAVHLPERLEREEPLVQLHPAHAEWVLLALVRAAGIAVQRHRDAESQLAHLSTPFCVAVQRLETDRPGQIHRNELPIDTKRAPARPPCTAGRPLESVSDDTAAVGDVFARRSGMRLPARWLRAWLRAGKASGHRSVFGQRLPALADPLAARKGGLVSWPRGVPRGDESGSSICWLGMRRGCFVLRAGFAQQESGDRARAGDTLRPAQCV